jgi:hypothetical protein
MGRGNHCTELTREELYAQVWAEPMTGGATIACIRSGDSECGLLLATRHYGWPQY